MEVVIEVVIEVDELLSHSENMSLLPLASSAGRF